MEPRCSLSEGGFNDEWQVFFDNVMADCDSPVANISSSDRRILP